MGSDVSGVRMLGIRERSWDLRAFPLVLLYCLTEKVRNGNYERGCKGNSIPKKSSLSD